MTNTPISAVILNWNRRNDTLQCLLSMQEQQGAEVDIIVVDNASSDDSVQVIASRFPHIHLIRNHSNLGYAGGNNVGIEHALGSDSEFVLVLNNDTVLDPSCLARLVDDLKAHPDAAAASPKSYYFDTPEIIYFAGGIIAPDGTPLHVGVGQPDGPEFGKSGTAEWLTGCATLFRSDALRKVGLFDLSYFLLFEDADWSLRARKAGYELRFVPGAKLWHKVSPSFGSTWSPMYLYYYTRNACLWIERNFRFTQRFLLQYHAIRRARWLASSPQAGCNRSNQFVRRNAVRQGVIDYGLRRFHKRTYAW